MTKMRPVCVPDIICWQVSILLLKYFQNKIAMLILNIWWFWWDS